MTTIESMQAELAALPAMWDVSGGRAQEEVFTRRRVLDARINAARAAANRVADLDAEINPRLAWRDYLIAWRPKFAEQLAACPPVADTREAEYRRLGLQISIQAIDRGFNFDEMFPPDTPLLVAMFDAGYRARSDQPGNIWSGGYGSLSQVESRIAELQQQRAVVQQQLNAALGEPIAV